MKVAWPILFGFICVAQLNFVLSSIIIDLPRPFNLSDVDLIMVFRLIAFGLSAILAVFTGTILINNFPDKKIAGRQKRIFNAIFFVSLVVTPFLIYFVILAYNQTPPFAIITKMRFDILHTIFGLFFPTAVLIFHLLILFGLYRLENFINLNVRNKQLGFK